MAVRGARRRVDPTDVAVRPAIDDVDPAVAGVAEQQTGAPVMSSSITASLTDSRLNAVVASATITGLNAATSSSASWSGAAIT